MRGPHVRFRERRGGVVPRAYSTVATAARRRGGPVSNYFSFLLLVVCASFWRAMLRSNR
jgi:hypothetical protein